MITSPSMITYSHACMQFCPISPNNSLGTRTLAGKSMSFIQPVYVEGTLYTVSQKSSPDEALDTPVIKKQKEGQNRFIRIFVS